MTETGPDLMLGESRAARRLGRLFRIEYNGGFVLWPDAVIRKLIERRGALVEELLLLDRKRRSIAAPASAELDRALAELAGEVAHAQNHAQRRLEQIGKDLRVSRGEGLPTGIHNRTNGKDLGKV